MKKKIIIIGFIIIIISMVNVWGYNNTYLQLSNQSSCSYVFVKKWGSMGKGDGEFGGIGVASESTFIITDEVIESLKNKIDEEKLKNLVSIKNKEFDKDIHGEFYFILSKKLYFTSSEVAMVMMAAALKKVSDIDVNGPLYIAADRSDNIYVSDIHNHSIQKFDSEGNFLHRWWGAVGEEIANDFRGITVDKDGYVYIVDNSNCRIQKLDSQGNVILKWGSKEPDDEQFELLSGIVTDPEGYIYVIATTSTFHCLHFKGDIPSIKSSIKIFDSEGTFIKKCNYDLCYDITIDSMGSILIASEGNPCNIAKYKTFEDIKTANSMWFLEGRVTSFSFKGIVKVATDKDGNFFILDKDGSCVYKLDPNRNLITRWGSFGSNDGQFNRPEAITVDSKGNVYVMDTGNYRIQKFAPILNTGN